MRQQREIEQILNERVRNVLDSPAPITTEVVDSREADDLHRARADERRGLWPVR